MEEIEKEDQDAQIMEQSWDSSDDEDDERFPVLGEWQGAAGGGAAGGLLPGRGAAGSLLNGTILCPLYDFIHSVFKLRTSNILYHWIPKTLFTPFPTLLYYLCTGKKKHCNLCGADGHTYKKCPQLSVPTAAAEAGPSGNPTDGSAPPIRIRRI